MSPKEKIQLTSALWLAGSTLTIAVGVLVGISESATAGIGLMILGVLLSGVTPPATEAPKKTVFGFVDQAEALGELSVADEIRALYNDQKQFMTVSQLRKFTDRLTLKGALRNVAGAPKALQSKGGGVSHE